MIFKHGRNPVDDMYLHILEKLPYFQAEQDLEELKGLIECSQGTLVSLDFPIDSYHPFTLQYTTISPCFHNHMFYFSDFSLSLRKCDF